MPESEDIKSLRRLHHYFIFFKTSETWISVRCYFRPDHFKILKVKLVIKGQFTNLYYH